MDATDALLVHPEIDLPDPANIPPGLMEDKDHDNLLEYLMVRLNEGKIRRGNRQGRYAKIDKAVAAWQQLSEDDTKREQKEEKDGTPQAISAIIPILHTHLEEMVSFYAGVFSPNSKDFYQLSAPETIKGAEAVVEKMNRDAQRWGYYVHLVMALRSLLKYNIGGFHVEWMTKKTTQTTPIAGNHISSVDMYNFFWDSAVKNPASIKNEAEWAAHAEVKTRFWLVQEGQRLNWWRLNDVFEDWDSKSQASNSKEHTSMYYRYPPADVGIGAEDGKAATLLDGYFAGINAGTNPAISGHEVVNMYCRLNPDDFNLLTPEQKAERGKDAPIYQLWRFRIIDADQIVSAEPVRSDLDEIPYYLGHMNVDDMGEASKSTAELLRAFQQFISFLFNIYVAGARGNIWGFIGINPKFFDTTQIKPGEVAGILTMRSESSAAHLSPSQGIARIQGNAVETRQAMADVASVMQLLQGLFPSQSLPSQVAGIDRAVKSQVAAVLQGVSRRLHMVSHVMDSQIMGPTRMAAFQNLGELGTGPLRETMTGLDSEAMVDALGSGLKQLNREAAATALQEIIYALIQSPEAVATANLDIGKLIEYWADMFEMDVDISTFQKAAPVQTPGQPGVDPTQQPPMPGMPTS